MTNEQLFDHILMLNEEGYEVSFSLSAMIPLVMTIKLQKKSFINERVCYVNEIRSYDMDEDSVIIHILSSMKAEFEQDMRLRIKTKGEDKHG